MKVAQKAIGTASKAAELLPLRGKTSVAASLLHRPIILLRANGTLCTDVQTYVQQVRLDSAKSSLVAAIVEGGAR